MLEIKLKPIEIWDELKEEFVTKKEEIVYLEHSLVSVSKWESKYKKPFLSDSEKSQEEVLDYFRMMVVGKVSPDFFLRIDQDDLNSISSYIEDPMTASWISGENESRSREVVTSELIYYWMVVSNIPFETQHWHLNRLMMLLRIYGEKTNPKKNKDKRSMMERQRALNEERKRRLGTNG